MSVPVIVVGNITVGGTGKTPLVIALVELLKQQGYQPGVISRGYGSSNKACQQINEHSHVNFVGDEPVLIYQRTHVPVVVGRDRVAAAKLLVANNECDVIISDDGLQHYALQRDIEIVVIDGQRRFGNGFCLPSGPLRESIHRLNEVDFLICNGQPLPGEYDMQYQSDDMVNIVSQRRQSLVTWAGNTINAVAGVGNPQRFFDYLKQEGLSVLPHVFPDHYSYQTRDLSFVNDYPVLMTEKDAIKCLDFEDPMLWYLPISARINVQFITRLVDKLQSLQKGK